MCSSGSRMMSCPGVDCHAELVEARHESRVTPSNERGAPAFSSRAASQGRILRFAQKDREVALTPLDASHYNPNAVDVIRK